MKGSIRAGMGSPKLGGVQLAILNSRLQGIVLRMANTLLRSGRSGVLNTAKDFSCSVMTSSGELFAMAESLPIHVMSGHLLGRTLIELQPHLERGDAFLNNSPYHGNTHPADHSILVPVIDDNGVHRFTMMAKGHQADCGNSQPTTYHGQAKDVYEEGALIFPAVRIQRDYRDVVDIIRMCEARIRVPEQWRGDYLAELGAARIGERQLLALGAEVGWDTLDAFTQSWFDYSEQKMIATIRGLSSGKATARSAHDPLPGMSEGIPVRADVEVDAEAATITVDLRDNLECQPFGLNLSEATSYGAALIGVFNGISDDVPINSGSFRRVRVHLGENCMVGVPRHPASCSVATTNIADRVANAVQRAIAMIGEGMGRAEAGLVIPPGGAVVSGIDPRHGGAPFVNQVILPGITGGAATPYADGWLTTGHVGNAGMALRDSTEIDELRFPLRVVDQRILADTEGAGRRRGAPGGLVEIAAVGTTVEAMYGSDGSVFPAEGVRNGRAGALAAAMKRTRTGEIEPAPSFGGVLLQDGESVISRSAGGGGYGSPMTREPERVLKDVVEGWVSRERAEAVYGVAIVDGRLDREATERLRTSLGAGSPAG